MARGLLNPYSGMPPAAPQVVQKARYGTPKLQTIRPDAGNAAPIAGKVKSKATGKRGKNLKIGK